MVHAKQGPQPPPFIQTSKKHSQRNKNRRRCPNGSAAYRCHHCGVGCECACLANGSGLEKKRGCEVCLPRTSSGSGHSSPSENCVFENMLPGLLQLRSDRFTKSALSRHSGGQSAHCTPARPSPEVAPGPIHSALVFPRPNTLCSVGILVLVTLRTLTPGVRCMACTSLS